MNRSIAFATAVVTSLFAAGPTRAGFVVAVSAQVTPGSGGLFRYVYTLSVDAGSTFSALDFGLDVAAGANLSSIATTSGWSAAYTPGDTLIYWFAPFDGSRDVLPGETAVFAFSSPLGPGPQGYSTFGQNPVTFDSDIQYGTASGPAVSVSSAVPAPPSVVLALAGAAAAAGAAGVQRRLARYRPA
jgi:hypothetical protein